MIRTIYQKLCQLLRSLLGWGGSDEDGQAEQGTDYADAASERDDGAEHDNRPDEAKDGSGDDQGDDGTDGDNDQDGDDGDGGASGADVDVDAEADAEADVDVNAEADAADPPADDGGADSGSGSDADENSQSESNLNHSAGEELDLDGMQNPCVGSDRWDHAPTMPTPPAEPDATIDATIWPEVGSDDVRAGCEMAAAHLEYVVLEAWGDTYDADVSVAEESVPEFVKDRAGFKEWAQDRSSTKPAEHINVHAGTDGPPGSACCGWGYVNVEDYFDGCSWDAASGCVKRRRWGPTAYGLSAIIHEGLHCIGISHAGDNAWVKSATVEIGGDQHSPVMGTSYAGVGEQGWHLIELHPDNNQRPELP